MERACAVCQGTGKVPLALEYERTLEVLEVHGRPCDLARALGISPNAMNNRLARMKALGLVKKESRGLWRKA